MSHSTVSAQAEQSSNHSASALGVSLTAAMLLAACGGGGSNPSPVPEAFVQPAWGSMAMMVTPGQASKVFNFPAGSCSAAGGDTLLFSASLEVKANGDVVFKAATGSEAATERFALAQSDTKYRNVDIYADSGEVRYVDYRMSNTNQYGYFGVDESSNYKSINLYAGEVERLYLTDYSLTNDFAQIQCSKPEGESNYPITLASLTPAIELGEQRAADAFLKGATDVLDEYDAFNQPSIVNGELVWRYSDSSTDTPTGQAWPSYSVNLSNGQWLEGFRQSLSAGLLSSPTPVRVLFSGLLSGGSYNETYNAASDDYPEARLLDLQIYGDNYRDLKITRLGNSLYIGDYFHDEF
jgi:hypothetical protein